jgi:hypothetical protein
MSRGELSLCDLIFLNYTAVILSVCGNIIYPCTKASLPLSIPALPCIPTWSKREILAVTSKSNSRKSSSGAILTPNENEYTMSDRINSSLTKDCNSKPTNSHIAAMAMLHGLHLFVYLTSVQELSINAFLISSSLLLGLPVSHVRYRQATQHVNTNSDIWAVSLINKSTNTAETCKTAHIQFAQGLTRMANEC